MTHDHTEATETEATAVRAVRECLEELYEKGDDDTIASQELTHYASKHYALAAPEVHEGLGQLLKRGECYYKSGDAIALVESSETENESVAEVVAGHECVDPDETEDDAVPRADGGAEQSTQSMSVAEFVRRSQADNLSPAPGVPRSHVVEELGEDRLDDAVQMGEVYVVGNRVKPTRSNGNDSRI